MGVLDEGGCKQREPRAYAEGQGRGGRCLVGVGQVIQVDACKSPNKSSGQQMSPFTDKHTTTLRPWVPTHR